MPQPMPTVPPKGAGFLVTSELDFRKEMIYLIVIDRFYNSCPGNDMAGREGLFDPTRQHWSLYWGGDLRGVIEKQTTSRTLA